MNYCGILKNSTINRIDRISKKLKSAGAKDVTFLGEYAHKDGGIAGRLWKIDNRFYFQSLKDTKKVKKREYSILSQFPYLYYIEIDDESFSFYSHQEGNPNPLFNS